MCQLQTSQVHPFYVRMYMLIWPLCAVEWLLYNHYYTLLPMFHIEFVVQVRFNPATYTITEGVNSYADITLVTHKPPTRSFYVWVNTRDGSALGKQAYAVHSLWRNLFQYHCT